jgi:hypothetical protein
MRQRWQPRWTASLQTTPLLSSAGCGESK